MAQQKSIKLKTFYGQFLQKENNVIYLYLVDDVAFDLENAQKMVTDVRSLNKSGYGRLLIVQAQNNTLTFEAQKYLSEVEGITHLALVVQNKIQARVAQFFLSLKKIFDSTYEMKVFFEEDRAEAWLLQS